MHSLIHQIQIIGNMKRKKKKKNCSLRGKNKSNSECNSHNGSLLEVDEKVIWGYFSSKVTITIQAKLSYIGLFFIKNLVPYGYKYVHKYMYCTPRQICVICMYTKLINANSKSNLR